MYICVYVSPPFRCVTAVTRTMFSGASPSHHRHRRHYSQHTATASPPDVVNVHSGSRLVTYHKHMSSAPSSTARAVLRIDLDALRANWAHLNRLTGAAECAGVVKADAYGLGTEEVTGALAREGCRTFFTATLQEAQRVRAVVPWATVYVLDGLLAGAPPAHYAGSTLRPVLSSVAEMREWAAFCAATGQRCAAAVQVDSGMNRLGVEAQEVPQLQAVDSPLRHFDVSLIMTHLHSADSLGSPHTAKQVYAFRHAVEPLRAHAGGARLSLANSGATLQGSAFHLDVVRPGIALYGGRAIEQQPNPMRPVAYLSARILQVRTIGAGEVVGYGASFVAPHTMRIATVACGYADGFLRALSGPAGGIVGHIGSHPVPIVGRVSMDVITLDVTQVPHDEAQRGQWVQLLGQRVTVDDLADRSGTIGYEVLTRISSRIHREYVEAEKGNAGD